MRNAIALPLPPRPGSSVIFQRRQSRFSSVRLRTPEEL